MTDISNPGGSIPQGASYPTAAPGAQALGAQLGVDKAALVFLGTAIAALVGLRLVFGDKNLPPMRIDATEGLKVYFLYQTINIPVKLIAYKYYGHTASQAALLLT